MSIFDEKRCYSPVHVAEVLATDICTVYRMIRNIENPLPAFKLKSNGQLRVHGKDLNEYLSKNKVDPLNE